MRVSVIEREASYLRIWGFPTCFHAGSKVAAGRRGRTSSPCSSWPQQGKSALLIAPTGGGKTLAGFLPSPDRAQSRQRQDLACRAGRLHTLYISPLKALATDIRRNLEPPSPRWACRSASRRRTGDTPQSRRLRQRERPPDILMTTPESLALLLSYPDAEQFFAGLRCVIVDELHALAGTKRGDRWRSASRGWRRWRRTARLRRPVRHGRRSAGAAPLPVAGGAERGRASCSGEPARRPRSRSSTPASACPGPATWAVTRCPEVYD